LALLISGGKDWRKPEASLYEGIIMVMLLMVLQVVVFCSVF
jgi:hypothetical protein